jgi:hypothetical protein
MSKWSFPFLVEQPAGQGVARQRLHRGGCAALLVQSIYDRWWEDGWLYCQSGDSFFLLSSQQQECVADSALKLNPKP